LAVTLREAERAVVLEIAHIVARAGTEDQLAIGYSDAIKVVLRHPGAQRAWALRQREDTRTFAIVIEWDSVEAHEDFRNSELLLEFRACVNGAVESAFGGHYDVLAAGE
jgi:heme-degrading monooxygenase HmoA